MTTGRINQGAARPRAKRPSRFGADARVVKLAAPVVVVVRDTTPPAFAAAAPTASRRQGGGSAARHAREASLSNQALQHNSTPQRHRGTANRSRRRNRCSPITVGSLRVPKTATRTHAPSRYRRRRSEGRWSQHLGRHRHISMYVSL